MQRHNLVILSGGWRARRAIRSSVAGPKVEEEIKGGKLQITNQPTAGYRCPGPASGYHPATNSVSGQIECRQSIHFPFRTAAEIGLPDQKDVPENQQKMVPYVMGGSYWAHVMIEHPTAGSAP